MFSNMKTIARTAGLAMFILWVAAGAAPETVTYTYDDLGRLKDANSTNASHVDYNYDAAGNRTSANYSPPDATPPSAPGTPTFTSLTFQSATASWTAATDNIAVAGYDWRLNSGTWQSIGVATSQPLTGLSASTLYTFEVRARDGAYNTGPSRSANFTTPAPQPGTLSFSPLTYSVLEDNTSVTVSVARSGGTDLAVAVNFATANGTASSPTDYTATSGTLNWAAGEGGSKTFSVAIKEDTSGESNETISLVLSNPTNGASIGGNGSITINDDEPGVLSIASPTYSVAETAGSVTISVNRVLGSYGAVSVQYATANGTAVAPGDYTTKTGTLNWATGDSAAKTVVVPIIDDTTSETDETFTFALSNATGGAVIGTVSTTATITDNDAALPGTPGRPSSNDNPSIDGIYKISWTAPTQNPGLVHHYVLEQDQDPAFSSPLSWSVTDLFKNFSGITTGEYYYRVKACTASNQCSAVSQSRLQVVCIGSCN